MEGRGFAGFIVGAVGGLGVDSEGGVDELGGMVVGECVIGLSDGVSEGGVGAVGAEVVDIGVSDITGASWLGVNVIGVARLQPALLILIIPQLKYPVSQVASCPFTVSYTRQPGKHIIL
jgi:hypothetical protein